MVRKFTCIICPNGCEITVVAEGSAERMEGAGCCQGERYVQQEMADPRRSIATSVLVRGGELPLASVRLTAPIPKGRIFDAMEEIKKIILTAPVKAGTVVIRHVLGLGSDVIVTRSVEKMEHSTK